MIDTHIEKFRLTIQQFNKQKKKMFVTSSFQTHSIPLIHLIGQIDPTIPIYFIDTGFHFPESIAFKKDLARRYNLDVRDVRSEIPKLMQVNDRNEFYFTSDPDRCCEINKTKPTSGILHHFDVWINGVRRDQNANRSTLKPIEETSNNKLRYHPMLEWTKKEIFQYIVKHNLPSHPLEKKGYLSIGCEPCTQKYDPSDERAGRWYGMNKTECGLHTDLIKQ